MSGEKPNIWRTVRRGIVRILCDPMVALCLSLMITLPVASAFSTDFGSAYTNTGAAVLVAAIIAFIASVAGKSSDED